MTQPQPTVTPINSLAGSLDAGAEVLINTRHLHGTRGTVLLPLGMSNMLAIRIEEEEHALNGFIVVFQPEQLVPLGFAQELWSSKGKAGDPYRPLTQAQKEWNEQHRGNTPHVLEITPSLRLPFDHNDK